MPNGQMDEVTILRALNVGIQRRPLKTFKADRTCGQPGCTTRLSVYNPSQRCWQHEPTRTYRPKVGRKRREDSYALPR